jgi:DNA-directed RNA polymerase II subunit RPB1
MDVKSMLDKRITMNDVNYAIKNAYGDMVSCVFSDYNADKLVFRIRLENIIKKTGVGAGSAQSGAGTSLGIETLTTIGSSKQSSLDQSDHIYILKTFRDQLLNNIVLRGVKGIGGIVMRKIPGVMKRVEGNYVKSDIWVLDTMGTNLMQVLALDTIDYTRTISNDIQEIYRVLGIEAARVAIMNELVESFDDTYINYHHLSVLCDRITANERMISIFRHGINSDNIGPIAKASFEETPEMFLKAARHAEVDNLRGVSSNVMCGQEGYFGTSSFNVLLNLRSIQTMVPTTSPSTTQDVDSHSSSVEIIQQQEEVVNKTTLVADDNIGNISDMCTVAKLEIADTGITTKSKDMGQVSEYYNMGF